MLQLFDKSGGLFIDNWRLVYKYDFKSSLGEGEEAIFKGLEISMS